MNNQNDNQTNTSNNNQNVLNQYSSSVKPNTEEVNPKDVSSRELDSTIPPQPTESQVADVKGSLKDYNDIPIDTPSAPTSLSDNLEASKSLTDKSSFIINNEPEPASEPEVAIAPETPVELKIEPIPEPESQIEPKIEITPEPEIQTQTPSGLPLQSDSEVELKPESKIVQEMDSDYNLKPQSQPTFQTETNTVSQPQEDPEKIKQKIEEVLSYSTANSAVNSPSDKPKVSGFVKFLFTFSLLIFLSIAGAFGYFYFNPKTPKTSETTTTPTIIPTESGVTCELNGFIYKQDQTFPSADGCNTCTCVSGENVICTEKACADITISPPLK